MKPLKLTMTAFGPYKNKEVIDFTALENYKLFVVAGDTGAGKTTIFDGICYALYGSASGMDRLDNSLLRSHFAEDDVHTVVELIFELSGKVYRVLRQPGHVKIGNKTKTGERYEFFEIIDEEEVTVVDRQIVSDIDEKIEELIGLTKEQFKQIVMLPQGEFQKLLTSDTRNKEDILRRLFKTERYNDLNDKLKVKRDKLNENLAKETSLLEHHIQTITSRVDSREGSEITAVLEQENKNMQQIIGALEAESEFLKTALVADDKVYHQSFKKYNEQQGFIQRAKMVNERFEMLTKKESKMKVLDEKKLDFLRREQKLDIAKRASGIIGYEEQVTSRRKELADCLEEIKAGKAVFKQAQDNLKKQETIYHAEKSKQLERDKVKLDLERYTAYLPTVREINNKKTELDAAEKQLKKQEESLRESKQLIDSKTIEQEKIQKEITACENHASQLSKKQAEIYQLREQYQLFDKYDKLSKKSAQCNQEFEQIERKFNQLRKKYSKNESIWLHNQATILASNLQEGDNCPVCGSTSHPAKSLSNQQVITKEELDKQRHQMELSQTAYNEILAKRRLITDQLRELANDINKRDVALENVASKIAEIKERGISLKAEVDSMEKSAEKINKLNLSLTDLAQTIKKVSNKQTKQQAQYQKDQTKYTVLETTFKEQLRNIDVKYQNLIKLEARIADLNKLKLKMEKSWEATQEQLRNAQEAFTRAEANFENAENQYSTLNKNLTNTEELFSNELIKAGFTSENEYKQAKMSEKDQADSAEAIMEYKQAVIFLQREIDNLNIELQDKQPIQMAEMEAYLLELKQSYEQALDTLNQTKKNIDSIEVLIKNLLESGAKQKEAEEKLAVVTDLYDTIRGHNPKKISFERYLQIDYLDRIMIAANERFRDLSDGQYYLKRSKRLESHGRPSGLAIDVYDSLTGQVRNVKTLSGGEKFVASLCLALGMSDVIQSFQGNISIETMFIDEGFGTLDEEFLNKAIDVLIELQNTGRTIGVISHREELKTIFPAMLSVEKTKEGYSRTKFILK